MVFHIFSLCRYVMARRTLFNPFWAARSRGPTTCLSGLWPRLRPMRIVSAPADTLTSPHLQCQYLHSLTHTLGPTWVNKQRWQTLKILPQWNPWSGSLSLRAVKLCVKLLKAFAVGLNRKPCSVPSFPAVLLAINQLNVATIWNGQHTHTH